MKFAMKTIALVALSATSTYAFSPARASFGTRTITTAKSMAVDPSMFHDLPHHVDSLMGAFSSTSMTLSDDVTAVAAVAGDAAAAVAGDATDAVVAASGNGWFGFLEGPIEGLLEGIHSGLNSVGLTSNTWGISIILMTFLIKLATFPLTKTQLESTNKMQALQPTIKGIQAKYASNPEVMNQKISAVYQENSVNPLAGCLPSVAQIPIFIGLYRAVLTLAKQNCLDESFLWLPNLEGPTYGADPAHGSDWILKGWVEGVPHLGWADTAAFLSLPIFLVLSQFASMQLMQPKTQDPSAAQTNAILKVLPLMIGWFSLNVPAALAIYWCCNNVFTTSATLLVKSNMNLDTVAIAGASATDVAPPAPPQAGVFTPPPMREKPSGFASGGASDDIKPITPIDAEVVSKTDDTASDEDFDISPSQYSDGPKKEPRKEKEEEEEELKHYLLLVN